MGKFWHGTRSKTPPNNGILLGDPVGFFEVLFSFHLRLKLEPYIFLGSRKYFRHKKKKMIAATTSLEKEEKVLERIILSSRIRTSDTFFFYLDSK